MSTAVEVHIHFHWGSVVFCASAEICSFMTLPVDILRPVNNMNSVSCVFRDRKASALPIPLMFHSVGLMMLFA